MKKSYAKIISLSSVYALGNVAQQALSILLLPVYTSYLSTWDFGVFTLMGVTILLLARIVSDPINTALSRFYYKPDYKDNSGLLLFNLFAFQALQIIVLSALYLYGSGLVCNLLFSNQDLIFIVRLFTIVLLLTPASLFLLALVRLREMAGYYVFLSLLKLIPSFGLTVYLLVRLKLGILALIYGEILGLVVVVLMGIPVFLKYSTFKISFSVMKQPLKYGYPLLLQGYSHTLIQSGDRYVLRIFNPISTVGLYSFGYKISSVVNTLLVEPLKHSLMPLAYKKESNPEGQKRFLANLSNYYYLFGVFVALGLSLFAKEVIMLLARRKEFWASWVIVPIVAFSYVQHGLGNFLSWGLIMKNKPYHMSRNILITAAVNIGLNFVFIPIWGILGAAFATLISYFIWNWLKLHYSAKFYQLHFDLKRLGHITVVGVGLYLLSLFIANTDSTVLNIAVKFLILFAYPLTFFITRFFTPKEKEYIKNLWNSIRANGLRQTYVKIKSI